jgi:AcrR family transcriptional regulator
MTRSAPSATRAYHHGDLRAALVAAAREVLETSAPEAVTLKSLAVKLGVSQSAPYRHFETREAVLAAVAADGFLRFHEALLAAVEGAPDGKAFERACLAYIAFGRANRGVYKLMFASPVVPNSADGPLEDAAEKAFEFLLDAVLRSVGPERAHVTAIRIWSSLHGLVMLEADGMLHHDGEAGPLVEKVVTELMATI